jgi:propionyl-CoA carboxylase beta chain
MKDKEILNDKIAQAHLGGGKNRIEKQHQKKQTENVNYLMDEGSLRLVC